MEKNDQILDKMADAQDIFNRKYELIEERLSNVYEIIDEDRKNVKEMKKLREQEIKILHQNTSKYFDTEKPSRQG